MAEEISVPISEKKEAKTINSIVIVHGHTIPKEPHNKPFIQSPEDEKLLLQEAGEELSVPPIWLSDDALLRAYAAGLLWEAGFAAGTNTLLIISGAATGGKEKPSEAMAIKQLIKIMFPHIPESQFVLEERAFNTVENALNIQELLKSLEDHKQINTDDESSQTLLLTSRYHIKRAQSIYKRVGIDVVPTVDIDVIQSSFYEFLENSDDKTLSYSDMENILEKQKRHIPTEKFFRLVDKIDPKSKITGIISRIFRQKE